MTKCTFLSLFCLIAFNAFADAGPPIPVPEISAADAIELAGKYFYEKETRNIDDDFFKKEEYILISVQYTNRFSDRQEAEWSWRIEFRHPIQNDHSVVYRVTGQKEVIFLYATE